MAKKKMSHSQSQSNDHKSVSLPPPTIIDDPYIQIQNLKNLNSVLLSKTTHHRNEIDSLIKRNNALQTSTMDAETLNLASELEKEIIFVYAQNQITEMGFHFGTERNERKHEVTVLKEQLNSLTLSLQNQKLLLSEERDQAENRERKAREEKEKIRLEAKSLLEEKREKEKIIKELRNDSVLAARNSRELEKVIEELKEKAEVIAREKNVAEVLNTTHQTKISQLEIEAKDLDQLLRKSRDEEELMRGKILELEASLQFALEKEEDMSVKNRELLMERKEMEKSIEILTEKRDAISRVLDMTQRELENKQHELNEVNRAKEEIEQVRLLRENDVIVLQGEIDRLVALLNVLKEQCRKYEESNEQLLSQVEYYRNVVDEVNLAKENMEKGFEEEKNKAESLELKIVEMEKETEQLLSQVQHYKNAVDEVKHEKDTFEKGYKEEKNKVESLELKIVEMEKKIEQLLSQVQHYKNAVDEVKHEKDTFEKGYEEEKNKVESLELKIVEMEKKTEQLLSQVQNYKNAVDEVKHEKDTFEKGYKEEKSNAENLKLKVVGVERKIEQAEAELGQLRIEKEKINEKNKELETRVNVLSNQKDALQGNLVKTEQERNDLRAKFESSCINSKQTLELLRSTSAVLSRDIAEEVDANGKKHEVEIKPYAEELDAIRKAFKVKTEMVDDMKQQVVSLQKSVAEANRGKTIRTGISSATCFLVGGIAAYFARGR